MLPRILVGLLIFAIQACPLRCGAMACGHNEPGAEKQAAPSCCPRCALKQKQRRLAEAHHSNAPVEAPGDSSTCGCQCVCSGAVVPKVLSFQVTVERSAYDAFVADLHFATQPAQHTSPSRSPAQLVRTTPGRLICCLNMSLLC